MGLFVSSKFTLETDDLLYDFVKRHKIPLNHGKKHYHCTLVFSQSDFDYSHSIELNNTIARACGWEIFGSGTNTVLVLLIESKQLHDRHKALREMGASYDFPIYRPHVTVACRDESFDHTSLPVPKFDLVLSHEYCTALIPGKEWDARKLIEDRHFLEFRDVLLQERMTVRPREPRI